VNIIPASDILVRIIIKTMVFFFIYEDLQFKVN